MYLNICMSLQSWNSHLIEMDNLPLGPIFLWLQGPLQDLREPSKGKSPEAICRLEMSSASQGTYVEWQWPGSVGLLEMKYKICPTSYFLSQLSPWPDTGTIGCSSDDTVPEKESYSNHFNLSVAQNPIHCSPLLQQTEEDIILGIYLRGMVETPPVHNCNKISYCFEFFDIPVCR